MTRNPTYGRCLCWGTTRVVPGIYVCMIMYVYVCVYMYVRILRYMCVCVYVYMYVYIYICYTSLEYD